jgi:hypothetical protein
MSTLGKNLIKVPDVSEKAKGGCNKAGNALNDAADDAGDFFSGVLGGGAGKAIDKAGDTIGGAAEDACNKGAEVADKAVQLTADVLDKVMGSIAKAIGIKEYYSVHIGALCYGEYEPLFSDKDAKPKVEKCSKKFYTGQTDLSKKLDEELKVGPFKFRLSDLDLVEDIMSGFDKIPKVVASMAFFFLFAVLALLGGFLCCTGVLGFEYVLQRMQNFALFGAVGCLGLGWLASFIGAAVVTGVAEGIKKAVNKHATKFGMSAATSPGFYVLVWGSVLFSGISLGMLIRVFLLARKGGQEQFAKNESTSSMEDSHGFSRAATEGNGDGRFKEEPL